MNPAALVSLFVRHRNAANLLMVLMFIAGIFGLIRLNTQLFPDFGIDMVSTTVVWSGASADDVDANIVGAIEPEVRFLDDVKAVRSFSSEGVAFVLVEFETGTDMQAALSDVTAAVAGVTTLPEDAEKPVVKRAVRYDLIGRLVVAGDVPERTLKTYAKKVRDELLLRGIDKHDGEVTCDSRPGRTCFEVRLPLGRQGVSDQPWCDSPAPDRVVCRQTPRRSPAHQAPRAVEEGAP